MPRRLVLALALACLTPVAWADFLAEYVQSGSDQGNVPGLSRIEVVGDHMRTDAGRISMLFDVGSGKMIVLMHEKKQYLDMAKVAQTAGAAMAQANAALANLPPEQRAMVEQRMQGAMMGAGAKVAVSVTPTGATDRVGNWPCEVYSTSVAGRHVDDSCLANSADAGITAADRATVHRAFDQIKAMTEKMSAGMFKSPMNQIPEGKFPVRITHIDDNGKTQTALLKGITTAGIGPADFSIPPGYTEQTIDSGHRH
jgi:hypothetical protein